MISIVYPIGNGSRWQNNELRYSLRSIQRHLSGVKDIWVVGDRPKWYKGNHIPHTNRAASPNHNIKDKVLKACQSEISDPFLFMMDDIFFLSDFTAPQMPYYHNGTIQEYLDKRGIDPYSKQARNTLNILNYQGLPTLHYDIHTPILYEKEAFKWAVSADWANQGYIVKSLYANSIKKPCEFMEDCKIKTIPKEGMTMFSTYQVLTGDQQRFLMRKFPDKSDFEI